MNTPTKLALAVILLLIPVGLRYAWFNRDSYTAPERSLDVDISLPESESNPYEDRPARGAGTVVFDNAHSNNLATNDLAPFQERLAARGVDMIFDDGSSSLAETLGTATAYIVLAPTSPFDPGERAAVLDFVDAGGRVFIAADPTRQVQPEDEDFLTLFDIFFPESAIPSANSLAGAFGIAYFDDYLYNLHSSEGNYRNVRYEVDPSAHPVNRGLEEVVLFAAHSLRGGEPLFAGDANTQSNTRRGETGLAPAVTAANGSVLLFGDLSLLTAPFHTTADNDRLLSNLSDWLATSERGWDLADFPYNFDGPVDLVPLAQEDAIDPRFLTYAGALQETFEAAEIGFSINEVVSTTNDALFVGTFADWESVSDVFSTNGISITLTTVETDTEAAAEGFLVIDDMGTVDISGTTIFLESADGSQDIVVVMAEDEASLLGALDMLKTGFAEDCIEKGGLVLCSTGEVKEEPGEAEEPEADGEGEEMETPGPVVEIEPTGKSIFVFSDDDGPEGVRTSAAEWEAALAPAYEITVWVASEDGLPSETDLEGFDAYIIDSGDYAYDDSDFDTLFVFLFLEKPILFIGAQPLILDNDNTAAIADLAISDTDDPSAAGLPDTITLAESESGVAAAVQVEEDLDPNDEGDLVILFRRGDASEEAGSPVLVLASTPDLKIGLGTFAFYRLPDDIRQAVALNIAAWLTAE